MELKEYFETTDGFGILSTADSQGRINAAVYARPHFLDDGTLALVMRDKLSHHNLQSNPHATYLFREEGSGYRGKRLYLTKLGEEKNTDLIESLRRRKPAHGKGENRFLVFFKLVKELPLIGDGDQLP